MWPDPARRIGYEGVIALCLRSWRSGLAAWNVDRNALLFSGCALPLVGWAGTFMLLRKRRPAALPVPLREPVAAYSIAAVLLLFVCGVLPGALLFLASFQLHTQSYIKNSQLV